MSYIDNTVDDAVSYKGKIDESINLFRQAPISSTVAAGTDGEDYEVDDWAPLTLVDGLVYTFRAHVDNTGPCSITHSATGYDIKLPNGDDPAADQILLGKIYHVQRSSGDLILLNAEPAVYVEFNYIINPQFQISQRGTSFTSATSSPNNDDTYLQDRWYLLSDGNDIVDVSNLNSNVTPGVLFDVETANKKFGYAQIIENVRGANLEDLVRSLSFDAYSTGGGGITNLRAALIGWNGGIDTVTSDFISAWGAAGTNPTLIGSASYIGTPVALPALIAETAQTFRIENIPATSADNYIVFIWSDHTSTTVGDQVVISNVKLQAGPVATPYHNSHRSFDDELLLCERFYQKSYDLNTNPGSATVVGASSTRVPSTSTNLYGLQQRLPSRMRAVPTITWYSTVTGTAARVRNDGTAADLTVSATTANSQTSTGYPTTGAPADTNGIQAQWTAAAEL